MNPKLQALLAGLALAALQPASAAISFSAFGTNGATGSSLSASVVFDIDSVNSRLLVTLANVGGDVMAPSDILTGVFFNSSKTFTPISARLTAGSTVVNGPVNGGDMGGEWAYARGIAAPNGANSGISSSGLGLFGNANFPPGTNLWGPTSVDGLQYGITSRNDNAGTGNAAVATTTAVPLIKHSVDFVLSFTGGFSLSDITNVSFQYGTALTEPRLTTTAGSCTVNCNNGRLPEPATLALVAAAALMGGAALRRRPTR